jgi:D-3-phosphoglycerate dehydrogenase
MAVGRTAPGGEAIGVLNLDALPPKAALEEVASHADVSTVRVIELPPAGQLPTWLRA